MAFSLPRMGVGALRPETMAACRKPMPYAWPWEVQVGIFAQRSVRLTLCLLRQIGVDIRRWMYSEIGADEDGAESASDDGLLQSIEEPMVEDGTMVGVAQIVDGVVYLVVGEGIVGLVTTDETPEGLV